LHKVQPLKSMVSLKYQFRRAKTIVPERIGDYVCKINVVGLDHKIENHRQLKISVVPTKPYISFTSSNHSLLRGESVQLRWNVQHAQSAMLEIDGQAQDVPLSSSKNCISTTDNRLQDSS